MISLYLEYLLKNFKYLVSAYLHLVIFIMLFASFFPHITDNLVVPIILLFVSLAAVFLEWYYYVKSKNKKKFLIIYFICASIIITLIFFRIYIIST